MKIKIEVTRDSVHPADESGLNKVIFAERRATLNQFVQDIQDSHFLPHIDGGKATWVIFPFECVFVSFDVESEYKPIGVMAQQWKSPKMINGDILLEDFFRWKTAMLRLKCYQQMNPDEVFVSVQTGNLPSEYGW